jgi:hypothetical protein
VYPRWISRIGAPLIAFVLTVAPSVSTVHAVEDIRKVSVVSFLFGDQGVFRSEPTGAARVVAGRFGDAPINVQYNSRKGGGATIEGKNFRSSPQKDFFNTIGTNRTWPMSDLSPLSGEERKSNFEAVRSVDDPYERWAKEPRRRRSVVISENMYILGLTAIRRVERDGLRRGGRGPAAWPDIDYVGSEI